VIDHGFSFVVMTRIDTRKKEIHTALREKHMKVIAEKTPKLLPSSVPLFSLLSPPINSTSHPSTITTCVTEKY
jgi:hypothetical protein